MALHRDLTGADLHEPKGVDTASANTVYVANGSGSGSWGKVGTDQINTSQFLNTNQEQFSGVFTDIGTSGSRWYGFARKLTVTKIVVVVQGTTGGSATILTFRNHAGASMGTITIPSTAVGGDVFTLLPSSNNTFSADQRIQVDSDGGTSGTPAAHLTFDLLWTP